MKATRIAALYAGILTLVTLLGYALGHGTSISAPVVGSIWHDGVLEQRAVETTESLVTKKLGPSVLLESAIGTGWIPPGPLKALSLASGRDGLRLRVGSAWVYFTPTDLQSAQVYDRGQGTAIGLTFGIDFAKVGALAKERLGSRMPTDPQYERVRFEAPRWAEMPPAPTLDASPTALRARASAAADYLARSTRDDGTFRYEVRATTMEESTDYNWVRHAGTVWFLARSARLTGSSLQRLAALRAMRALRSSAYQDCGTYACIGKGEGEAELGASALGLLAFLELDRGASASGSDPSFTVETARLSAFLLAAQKPNGDFHHLFDRTKGVFVDRYRMYYTGEAALALARFGAVNAGPPGEPATTASAKALDYISSESWRFPGNRYYTTEEHWTCQALEELWAKKPNEQALRFCLNWAEVIRAQRIREGEGPAIDVGASRVAPVMAPRLTPVASRAEALIAILAVLRRTDRLPRERALLAEDVHASLSLLAKYQFGLSQSTFGLLRNPALLHGAFPTSRTLWDVRIDSVQHAGNAFLDYAAEEEGVPFVSK